MSKRSDFEKVPRDFYPTSDPKALPEAFIKEVRGKTYAEPCCGAGDLVDLLVDVATCKWESDIEYRGAGVVMDAHDVTKGMLDRRGVDLIITNPPYTKGTLLPMIDHFISLKPTWLLLPADFMHNLYFGPYMKKCSKVISIGRLKWVKGSKYASTDNFCWYYWEEGGDKSVPTVFTGR